MTEESIPAFRRPPEGALMTIWVIYDHPKDYPTGYVLRAQYCLRDGKIVADPIAWYASHPDQLRAALPAGVIRFYHPDPNRYILETWF